jgi:calcineurin-like phosphoesterase family protein
MKMSKIWITSDWHFGHEKDFIWQPRGYDNWFDGAVDIIEKFNNLVSPNDIVYVLGDCPLKNTEFGINCMHMLYGKKYLAYGNHDSDARIERYKEANIFEDIQMGYRLRKGKYIFYLTHYPMKMGNYKEKHPVWNLSGHTHKSDKFENGIDCCYNIALDAHNNLPVSLDQIIADIEAYRMIHPVAQIRCDKCVYEFTNCGDSDSDGQCKKYKRDPPDGGYYG